MSQEDDIKQITGKEGKNQVPGFPVFTSMASVIQ
jgi:hypothetical protein